MKKTHIFSRTLNDNFTDYGIRDRHMQLDATIDILDMETESFDRAKLFSWIFFPIWTLLTIIQAFCFVLCNGQFHPLVEILQG